MPTNANDATSGQDQTAGSPAKFVPERISAVEPQLDAERLDVFHVAVEFQAIATGFAAKADAILRDQLLRASTSIVLNIAEALAAGRGGTRPASTQWPAAAPPSAGPSFIYCGRGHWSRDQ